MASDVEVLAHARRVAASQAEDAALWSQPLSAFEAYAQQELRTLTSAVEGDLTATAAIEDP